MAIMIPALDPVNIENWGESTFYRAAQKLPQGYTVLYSYKFRDEQESEDFEVIREADFVIVHPSIGYLVVEVKSGDIDYRNGVWYEYKMDGYRPMYKDPVEQARNAAFAILSAYRDKAKDRFPLSFKYAIAFPQCSRLQGDFPSDLDPNSVFLFGDMDNLENKILDLFQISERRNELRAVNFLLDRILAPSFRVFAGLEDRINIFCSESKRVLNEEQQRILDETELNRRMVFLGAAGSGKTFVAMEKARRLAKQGKRVLLTCFNRSLASVEFAQLSDILTASNFHDYLENLLKQKEYPINKPDTSEGLNTYYDETLPDMAFDYFSNLPDDKKFEAIVVAEGQDFKPSWITCLESMLVHKGEFYIFADPNQDLFNAGLNLLDLPVSKAKLTRNLRNTEYINDWINDFMPDAKLKSLIKGGMTVRMFAWDTLEMERKLIEDEAGRLVSQGI